jgi:uncharacterized protein
MNHTEILDVLENFTVTQEHKQLCSQLGIFVETTCGHRDPSHGYEHMKQVAKNSLVIFNKLNESTKLSTLSKSKFVSLLLAISWLHDVADRKYDNDGTLKEKLVGFIQSIFEDPALFDLIINTILRTSYSFELNMIKNTGTVDWFKVLGEDGTLLRDIVSDADKMEAIGAIGVLRCMTYNIELLKKSGIINPTFEELIGPVKIHAEEKLLKLKDNYIRTIPGKELVAPLHNEMLELLSNDLKLRDIFDSIKY